MVVPFSTMAVPEAMLEILPLVAVFTTCIQFTGILSACLTSICDSYMLIKQCLQAHGPASYGIKQQHKDTHLAGPGAGSESQLPIVVEQAQSQGPQLLRQQHVPSAVQQDASAISV